MKEKKTEQPKVRFKGFTDAWEQRKFADMYDVMSGFAFKMCDYTNDGVPIVNGESINNGDVSSNNWNYIPEYFRKDYSNFILKTGDIVLGLNRPITNGELKIAQIPSNLNDSLLYQRAGKIKILNGTDANFSYQILNKEIHKFVLKEAVGSDQPFISTTKLKKWEYLVPADKAEQERIGSFFTNLDNLITLHQREYEIAQKFKKTMLSKMFPKNGADKPELRFAGFTDAWEQRKFEEYIISIQTGTNLLGAEANNGTPLLKMGNIQRGYFSFKKLEYLDESKQVEEENIAHYGDFLFNTRNTLELVGKGATWTGESGKYAFNSNIARFVFKGIDTIFFNYLYNTQGMINQVHARAVGTTSVAAVYPRDLNSLKCMLPSLEEQEKIGMFFKNIDHIITLHQRELESLKNMKKTFSQQMFV